MYKKANAGADVDVKV